MMVLHGAGGLDEGVINAFGPYASSNDIIMVWPTANTGGWDETGRTGGLYKTKYSIQNLFVKEIIKQVS